MSTAPPSQNSTSQDLLCSVVPDTAVRLKLSKPTLPRYVLCRVIQPQPGQLMLQPVEMDLHLRKVKNFCMRKLGLEISDETLERLITAGFVKAQFPSPRTTLVHVGSVVQHLINSSAPGYWTRERRMHFMRATDELRGDGESEKE